MNKKILAIAAMDIERTLLLNQMTDKQEHTLGNGSLLVCGKLDNNEFSILLCGIGKVNAAIGCALAIDYTKPDIIVNTGVAGGLLANQKPGDVVISYQATYHDVDVTAFGYKMGQLPESSELYTGDNNIAKILYEESRKDNSYNTTVGLVISGDKFINNTQQIETILKHFPQAHCTEMEAAAIAHTAYLYNKAFIIIRAISDKADTKAKNDYNKFVKLAAERSSKLVKYLVNHYA